MVEFGLTVMIFIFIVMGVFDLGRAIFQYNGVSEAARDIARVTSVHPGTTLGNSSQTQAVVAQQKGIVWNLSTPTFACVDIAGAAVPLAGNPATQCLPGNWVRVTITAAYSPITPPLQWLVGNKTLSSTSSIQIP